MKLIGLVGTNSKKSTNRELLKFMKEHFSELADIELVEIDGLPVFNKPENKEIPAQAQEIANKIEAADGLIISTPEYNHAITSALANALHWLSYYIHPMVNKPVMITGASYGRLGSSRAQAHLRQILDSPDIQARVLPNSEFLLGNSLQAFDEDGKIKDPETIAKLENIFDDFMTFIELTGQLKKANQSKVKEVEEFSWEETEEDTK